MDRKQFLKSIAGIPLLPIGSSRLNSRITHLPVQAIHRVRPGDPNWPSKASWNKLKKQVGGRLSKINSPLNVCLSVPHGKECDDIFKKLKSPFYIRNNPALTQSTGWLDAWKSEPSVYAVKAKKTGDVVAAVNFARKHNLRLVVKGGAHSYQGRSNAPDSLLIWMRPMDSVEIHDAFTPKGAKGNESSKQAVTIGGGAIWIQAYDKVTTQAGRYVQGGGCLTVGVAGLIQSGGFGSFSKKYGLAASGLLEAEVVTADGKVRIANAYQNSDLFWAIKGGGGGSFGVVTSVTLQTHVLPNYFGIAGWTIQAKSESAYYKLIEHTVKFYRSSLFNSHWGEQIKFKPGNILDIGMMFQGLDQKQAEEVWKPFKKWIFDRHEDFEFKEPLRIGTIPARDLWNIDFFKKHYPQLIIENEQPDAPANSFIWAGDRKESGEFWDGYHSLWLPESLLKDDNLNKIVDALFAASRQWETALHFNKGLAGAPVEVRNEANNTAMNPVVTKAFALAIIAGNKPPAFSNIPGHEPDITDGRKNEKTMNQAISELVKIVPQPGSYVAESNYFEKNWQQSFWGANYPRLARIKKKYDPDGLFYIHHGVGSEEWTDNGFTKNKTPNVPLMRRVVSFT
ncbi:MAG TPA: FAD-binding oxidoreductase [Balneolaceae bacterium]|nr:FAD-binding oxidoreductase [Balneolaceae bacterium]